MDWKKGTIEIEIYSGGEYKKFPIPAHIHPCGLSVTPNYTFEDGQITKTEFDQFSTITQTVSGKRISSSATHTTGRLGPLKALVEMLAKLGVDWHGDLENPNLLTLQRINDFFRKSEEYKKWDRER